MNIKSTLFCCITTISFLLACQEQPAKENKTDQQQTTTPVSSFNYADSINNGTISTDTLKGSPARTTTAIIGKTRLTIAYHSPGVKDRIIWGGLVPYNKVWVTGAHSATSIQIDHPITIADKKIETGKYAIFTIPSEKEWIVIINKNHQQHLADDYTETEDVMRLTTKPTENQLVQRLTYSIVKQDDQKGEIVITWEKIKIIVPFSTIE